LTNKLQCVKKKHQQQKLYRRGITISTSIEKSLKEFLPIIKEARKNKLNEADTRTRVQLFLERVLGYDLLKEITQEHMVSSHYVDLAIKIRGDVKMFIEVKPITAKLRDVHVSQAVNYAANEGINTTILTNLDEWRVYHVSLDDGKVNAEPVLEFSLLSSKPKDVLPHLKLISREGLAKGHLNKYMVEATSVTDRNLLLAMLSEPVLRAITKELKTITGHRVNQDTLKRAIINLFSEDIYKLVQKELKKREGKEA